MDPNEPCMVVYKESSSHSIVKLFKNHELALGYARANKWFLPHCIFGNTTTTFNIDDAIVTTAPGTMQIPLPGGSNEQPK